MPDVASRLVELEATLNLAVKLLAERKTAEFKVAPKRSRKSIAVILGLYVKAIKTASSVHLLASRGRAEDGFVLCRTLLETAVAIFYVLQRDTPLRAEEYMAHMLMRTQKIMGKWKDTRGLRARGKAISKIATETLVPYQHLGADRLKQLRGWYSGDPTIEETFKRVNGNRTYQTLYLRLTGHQHVSDLDSHIAMDEKGVIDLKLGPSDPKDVVFLVRVTNDLLWRIVRAVNGWLRLGGTRAIQATKPR